jgi:cholesterol transport system auxiliary component
MTLVRLAQAALLVLGMSALGACSTISSLNAASKSLDTYELRAASLQGVSAARSSRILLVAPPTATAAIDSDRILIKPSALQVQYLPDARWVDAAPVHVQALLARSIANSGLVRYAGNDPAGPIPDYVLLTDLQVFQAETSAQAGIPYRAVVRMTLTLVRDSDRRIIASRRFEHTGGASSSASLPIVSAFDAALNPILRDATVWTANAMAGRSS